MTPLVCFDRRSFAWLCRTAASAIGFSALAYGGLSAEVATPTGAGAEPSPVCVLHLDGDIKDSGPHALYTFAYGVPEWAPGHSGQAGRFAGQRILAVGPRMQVGGGSWTVELWAKPEKRDGVFFTFDMPFGKKYFLRAVKGPDGLALEGRFAVSDDCFAVATSSGVENLLYDGAWHQLALVLDRSRNGEVRLYLDGRQVAVSAKGLTLPLETETGHMSLTVGTPWYHGLLDEVRVFATVPERYRAAATAGPPPAVATRPPPPPEAALPRDAAVSLQPLEVAPATTRIALPSIGPYESDVEAAELLRNELRRAYGVDKGFDIQLDGQVDAAAAGLVLAVGRSRWLTDADLDSLGRNAILIRRKGNVVCIAGQSPQASLWAAVAFLDQSCGIRFYLPGTLFTSSPKALPVALGPMDVVSTPDVAMCAHSGLVNSGDSAAWARRNALGRRRGGSHQHNMGAIFPPERFSARFPEIYPILPVDPRKPDGEVARKIPAAVGDQDWQPCFSEPNTVVAALESIVAYFREDPGADHIAVSVQDGHNFCKCPRCKALIAEAGGDARKGYTRMYHRFLNTLAARMEQELPRQGVSGVKKLVFIAYVMVGGPPEFDLHPSILPIVVEHFYDMPLTGSFADPAIRVPQGLKGKGWLDVVPRLRPPASAPAEPLSPWETEFWSNWDAWSRHAKSLGIHEWAHGKGMLIPNTFTGKYSVFCQLAQPYNLDYFYVEAYPAWGLQAAQFYVLGRLLWDADADAAFLWRRFCEDMFGPAAADEMVRYFDCAERFRSSYPGGKLKPKMGAFANQLTLCNDDQRLHLRQAREHLDRARPLLATPQQQQRFATFDNTFRLTEQLIALHAKANRTPEEVEALKKWVDETIAPEPLTLFRDTGDQEKLRATYREIIDNALR